MKKRLFLLTVLVALLGVGLYTLTRPAPIAHAAPPTSHTVIRTSSGPEADAGFLVTQGDLEDFVSVVVSPKGFQAPTSISGPAVVVNVKEVNLATNEVFFGGGVAPAPELQFDTKKLTSATLPEMTVPVFSLDENGNQIGEPVPMTVALTWTGVGSITTQSEVSHYRVGHEFSEMFRFKGTSRNAMVSGTVSYPSPLDGSIITFTSADSLFAQMMSQGTMDIIIQR